MKRIIVLLPLLTLCSCAVYRTVQTDTSYDKGQAQRKITTKVSTCTFLDSSSALSKSKVTQTDKSQSSAVGSLEQSATTTNASQIFEAVGRGVIQGLK